MPNLGYHLARFEGNLSRSLYRILLPRLVRTPVQAPRSLAFDVFSYSGEPAVPEQIASIRSFLRNVGRPKSFTVVSDGSHSGRSIRLLKNVDPCVRIESSIAPASDVPPRFRQYLTTHPTGKQLALIMSLPTNGPALYLDSDVLFFNGGIDLVTRATEKGLPAFYLADCGFSGDSRLLLDATEEKEPVNTGVLLLLKKLDWVLAGERFLKLDGPPTFFTNQTLTHLVMHASGARPFDPAKYILKLDDQFAYADRYANSSLVLRHYVNPVRHKFWTTLIH
ncbi:MAG TPA: hypothetical protein VEI58_09775 [Chthoniobacterales bacterium]|nr:hypothetical protein [Chthoniobacterales bacterium]